MSQQRQLAAILFTDIVGYTALMQENEQKAVALIKHYNSTLEKNVAIHEGKVLNYYGDGSLCIFSSALESLNCAIDLQRELQTEPVVSLRIGLHIGEIFFEDGKALGDGVNIASRIQSLGQANTILLSYTMTGRTDSAFQWLQKGFDNHEVEMHWLKADRLFSPLHNDLRFQELLNKIGFK